MVASYKSLITRGVAVALALTVAGVARAQGAAPSTVTFTGGRGNISNTVAIPANAAVVWTLGYVVAEVGRLPGAAPAASHEETGEVMSALAPAEFPVLTAAVAATTWGLPDGEFAFGLEAVVRGLEAVLSDPA